ncbi:unnamed protein product [Sphagnum jensenii]|uniref:Glucosylceramidase n=1 Tax=Sphagnum jensenii TaxID=128206 RepID=A0ABP0VGL1_9BRYO
MKSEVVLIFAVCIASHLVPWVEAKACKPRDFGRGSIVCVCDEHYCDDIEGMEGESGRSVLVTSNKAGLRFERFSLALDEDHSGEGPPPTTVAIDRSKKLQKVLGFGAAFSDSTSINIKKLPDKLRLRLLRDYFGQDGLEYNMGRVPLGATDFSVRKYTYNDVDNDEEMVNMQLAEEDLDFKTCSVAMRGVDQRDFVKLDLGPELKKAGLTPDKLKLFILDDNLPYIPEVVDTILQDTEAAKYVSGVATHWYETSDESWQLLDGIHENYPDQEIVSTEACNGYLKLYEEAVTLGNWTRAERYAVDILQSFKHWNTAWIDWNLALDMEGGPNWVNNTVDAPIIINHEEGEYYKNPMFYAIGQFSKFVPPGSVRIESSESKSKSSLMQVAFETPEKEVVLVVINRSENEKVIRVKEGSRDFSIHLSPESINTAIWKA